MPPGSATAEFKPLEVEEVTPEQEMFRDKEQTTNIIYLAKKLKELDEHIKELKDKSEELKAELAQKEQTLYHLMIEQGVGKLNIDGKTLSPTLQYWASIPDNFKPLGFEQLMTLGMGSHIKKTVNSQTLSAEIREMIDRGELVQDEKDPIVWWFKGGELDGKVASIKITGKPKISIRKG